MPDIYKILGAFSEPVYVTDVKTKEMLFVNAAAAGVLKDRQQAEDIKSWRMMQEKNGEGYIFHEKQIEWDGREAVITVAIDVTENENRKKELETRLETERFIVKCIAQLHRNKSVDSIFSSLLSMTGEFFDTDRVYIFDYDGQETNNTYEWCRDGVEPQKDSLQKLDVKYIKRWLPIFEKGECVIIEDIESIKESAPDEYEVLNKQNIHSLIAAPIDDNDKLIGYIGMDNIPSEKLRASELFFTTLSYFVSSVICRRNNEECLRRMSYTDSLTGLFNRNKFIEDTKSLSSSEAEGIGVLYMDLNGLKEINDEYGHDEGDKAIKIVSECAVKSFCSESIYRVGGDEFVVLFEGSEDGFDERINELQKNLGQIEYTVSAGWQYSTKTNDIENVIKAADEKMYTDKKHYYRDKQDAGRYRHSNDLFSEVATYDALKKLIEGEKFKIWFQPRFSVETGQFCGSEALVRYFTEKDVLVSPMDFVPEMEEHNTIHMIDFYVFRHVCGYLSQWVKSGKNVKPVSINISNKTMMRPNFVENLMNIWYDYNIPKELIEIEVSENKEKGGVNQIIDILAELKKKGFKIAIDNFGYKYADIYLFTDLKFDILKLDKDLVYRTETDEKTMMLSRTIANICREQNIKIVAEGVENEKVMEMLKELGCDEAQGYMFDKPMSSEKFEEKYL